MKCKQLTLSNTPNHIVIYWYINIAWWNIKSWYCQIYQITVVVIFCFSICFAFSSCCRKLTLIWAFSLQHQFIQIPYLHHNPYSHPYIHQNPHSHIDIFILFLFFIFFLIYIFILISIFVNIFILPLNSCLHVLIHIILIHVLIFVLILIHIHIHILIHILVFIFTFIAI